MNRNRKVISGAIISGMLAVATTVSSASLVSGAGLTGRTAGIFSDMEKIYSGKTTTATTVLEKKAAKPLERTVYAGALSELGENLAIATGLQEEKESLETTKLETVTEALESVNADMEVSMEPETELMGAVDFDAAVPGEESVAAVVEEEVNAPEPVEANVEEKAPEAVEPEEEVIPEEAAPALTEEQLAWENKLMVTVEESLNIRSDANEESEVVGKLYAGSAADIIEIGPEWTHITSGGVEGFVKNEYCVFGQEAFEYAKEHCPLVATTTTEALRLREDGAEDAGIISTLEEGTNLYVSNENEENSDWLFVSYNGTDGYVSSDYVEVSLSIGEAISIEEEQARIAAEEAERKKKEQAQSGGSSSGSGRTNNGAVAADASDVALLGALIQCEAGNECYEGQVAVGAAVMNRLRSGAYGGSVRSVIYAAGQFSPAGSGQVDAVLASGVKGSCLQAAQEALNGVSNIGGCVYFRNVSCGHDGIVIGNHVFW